MTIKIGSLNVNGRRAMAKQKELWRFIKENQIDILGLQEFNAKTFDVSLPDYKIEIGYNGTELGSAFIYNTQLGLQEIEKSSSGRIMKLVFKKITVINVYGYQPGLGAEKRNNLFLRELPA